MRNDSDRNLSYVFTKDEYYFLSVSKNCENGVHCFTTLGYSDAISIPKGWRYYGGKLSNWFPEKVSATLPFDDYVILFYDKKACFLKLNTNPSEVWPNSMIVFIYLFVELF